MERLIHRFWSGPKMPSQYVEYGHEWERLNPEWDVIEWDEKACEDLVLRNKRIWDHVSVHGGIAGFPGRPEVVRATQLADIAAYEIIHRYGGIYVNCDVEPIQPLTRLPVLWETDAFAFTEFGHWVNNGTLGGPAGHPFWDLVIEELPKRFDSMPGEPMHRTTGPHLLTEMHQRHPGQLKVLGQRYFNPFTYDDIPLGGLDAKKKQKMRLQAEQMGAVAVHWWGHKNAESRTDV